MKWPLVEDLSEFIILRHARVYRFGLRGSIRRPTEQVNRPATTMNVVTLTFSLRRRQNSYLVAAMFVITMSRIDGMKYERQACINRCGLSVSLL